MKKKVLIALILVLLVGLSQVSAAEDHGAWSIGLRLSAMEGVQVTGGYETIALGVGYDLLFSSGLTISLNGYHPFEITESFRLGPGLLVVMGINVGSSVDYQLFLSPICGMEYFFSNHFSLVGQIGYFALTSSANAALNFNTHPETLLATFQLGARYYF